MIVLVAIFRSRFSVVGFGALFAGDASHLLGSERDLV